MQWHHPIIQALSAVRFLAPEMALADFSLHNLAVSGYLEAVLRTFMRFEFWHYLLP